MTVRNGIFAILALAMTMVFTGCEAQVTSKPLIGKATQADLKLKYEPGQTATYKSITEFRKDYKFEQPSLNTVTEKLTITVSEITYDQTIEEVDDNGNAVANITIRGFKYNAHSPQGMQIDFDSSKNAETDEPLMKVIGKSYKIKLDTAGRVLGVIDAKDIRNAAETGDAKKIVQVTFNNENIKKAHSVLALPDTNQNRILVGASWNRIQASPKGMFKPKNYEKIYTLKKIDKQKGKNVAIVEMSVIPTSKRPEKGESEDDRGMGLFEKLFTSSDDYTGRLVLDIDDGSIKNYREKLTAVWIAAESSEKQRSDKGPDVLTMGFTLSHSIEAID